VTTCMGFFGAVRRAAEKRCPNSAPIERAGQHLRWQTRRGSSQLTRTKVGRNFFANEWNYYFPGQKYRKTFRELPGPEESGTQQNN
jgi:hypothetical protein